MIDLPLEIGPDFLLVSLPVSESNKGVRISLKRHTPQHVIGLMLEAEIELWRGLKISSNYDKELSLTGERGITKPSTKNPQVRRRIRRNPGTQYLIGVEEGDVGSEATYFLKAKR